MSNIFSSIQSLIFLAFGLAAVALSFFGLVDTLRHRPDAFTAAGKRTKNFWLIVLGVALALSFVSVFSAFGLPWILAVVGAGVYAADVRPALRRVMGRGSGDGPSGRW
jgi:Protein of unknown function (DUF2516)